MEYEKHFHWLVGLVLHEDLDFNVRHRDASASQQSKALLEELQSAGHGGLPEVWSQGLIFAKTLRLCKAYGFAAVVVLQNNFKK